MSEVFGADYAAAYDALYAEKDYEGECNAIERALAEYGSGPVRRVLDLGCGTCGHAVALARRGFEVIGVDRSAAMLAVARAKVAAAGVADRVELVCGDLAATRVEASCDLALMMFAVLGYLAEPGVAAAALRATRASLRQGGLFIFDLWYGPAVLREPPGQRWRMVERGSERFLRFSSGELDADADLCTVSFHMLRLRGNRVLGETVERHRVRYYHLEPLAELLHGAGFDLLRLGGFPDYRREAGCDGWSAMGVARAMPG